MTNSPTPYPERWGRHARRAIATAPPNLSRNGFPTSEVTRRDALCIRQVSTAVMFLALGPVERLSAANKRAHSNSYGLKHQAEIWGEAAGLEPYVANGELIAAALYLGFTAVQIPGTPNALINVRGYIHDERQFDRLNELERREEEILEQLEATV